MESGNALGEGRRQCWQERGESEAIQTLDSLSNKRNLRVEPIKDFSLSALKMLEWALIKK